MTPLYPETVAYASRAAIRHSAPLARLAALVAALERSGAHVRLDPEGGDLHFAFPCRYERWIVLGGLAGLFEGYVDVVSWDRSFEERWDGGGAGSVE